MRRLLPLVLLAALSGCAASRYYADPTGDLGAYARITIRNAAPAPLSARLYEDPVSCSGQVALQDKGAAVGSGEAKAVYAKKGEPFTIGALYWGPPRSGIGIKLCNVTTTFLPTAASYEVVHDADASVDNCSVVWAEGEGKSARALPRERFVARKANQPFLETGPWCKALTDEERATLGVAKPAAAAN